MSEAPSPALSNNETIPYSSEKIIETNIYSQWITLPDNKFVPTLQTIKKIPAGLYELKYDNSYNNVVMCKKTFILDELYELPTKEIEEILDDIKKFWDRKDIFKKYSYIHKRGILLYGEPGCGKSGIIQLCCKYIIEKKDGIVINIKDYDDIENFVTFISTVRQIETDRPFIVLMEDIDSIIGENKHSTSKVLNILDGIKQIGDVVYIATTNYPDRLEERITNRPSRFDRRYEIGFPLENIRRVYLENKLGKDFKDIDLWVKETEGMSIAHIKELIISVIVLNNSFDETLYQLNSLKKKVKLKGNDNVVGFGKI